MRLYCQETNTYTVFVSSHLCLLWARHCDSSSAPTAYHFTENQWCAPVLAQAVEKVRATPGFAAAAGRAKQAYQAQTAQAAEAVRTYAAACGLNPGDRMMWRHRPDVSQAGAFHG